ncbi:MAG: DUF6768 family protein [Parvularculaceae bacterium]
MPRVDELIDEAVDAEERELLRSIGDEPRFIQQALGIFSGRTGWVSVVLMFVQGLAFIGGAWATWKFFMTNDVLAALHWGLPAAVLLLTSLTIKLALWPSIQTNRLMRELKRIELQIARSSRQE